MKNEELKKSFSDAVANINAFLFKYKTEAQKDFNLDDKIHVGIMAQELQKNPVTKPSVIETPDGHLEVNIKDLCIENTALIADIVRRLEKIEAKLEEL